jgi:hypothetical protein
MEQVTTATKTKTSIAVSLGVAVMMLGALCAGAGMAMSIFPLKVAKIPTTPPPPMFSCGDNDPGDYPHAYGHVNLASGVTGFYNGEAYKYKDWCAGNNIQLMEYYCYRNPDREGYVPGQTGYNCQNGCTNGACNGIDTPTCTDSQPEPDIYQKGFVQGVDTTENLYRFEDECSGSGLQVSKYWCYDNPDGQGQVNGQQVLNCPSGQCANGACLKCTDTDNGHNYSTQGTVADTFDDPIMPARSFTDQCIIYVNENGFQDVASCTSQDVRCSVREGYCSTNYYEIEEHLCPHGCQNGACLN